MFDESLTFGERLKLIRERKGVLQKELADFLQVKQQTVSAWEKNVGQPDIETIKKIAAFFDVSTDYLLGHSKKQTADPKTSDNKTIKKSDLREGLSEEEQRQLEFFREFLISQRKGGEGRNEQAAAMGK